MKKNMVFFLLGFFSIIYAIPLRIFYTMTLMAAICLGSITLQARKLNLADMEIWNTI